MHSAAGGAPSTTSVSQAKTAHPFHPDGKFSTHTSKAEGKATSAAGTATCNSVELMQVTGGYRRSTTTMDRGANSEMKRSCRQKRIRKVSAVTRSQSGDRQIPTHPLNHIDGRMRLL